MINALAITLIVASILQIGLAILVLLGKFDPLLPKERRVLPTKVRKMARLLNAIAMIASSCVFFIMSAGLLLNSYILLAVAAVTFCIVTIVMLVVSFHTEGKYLKR